MSTNPPPDEPAPPPPDVVNAAAAEAPTEAQAPAGDVASPVVPALLPPPLPPLPPVSADGATTAPDSSPAAVPSWLWAIVIAAGVAELVLACTVTAVAPIGGVDRGVDYRIGTFFGAIVGGLVFSPGLVIGVFSIFRRFRNPLSRVTLVGLVWGFLILGQLSLLARREQAEERRDRIATKAKPAGAVPAPQTKELEEPASLRAPTGKPRVTPEGGFDLSRGSDERLIALIEVAQEERYLEIVEAYQRACRAAPTDARLALERVKFIEHFAWSEDVTIESAEEDLEVAEAYLATFRTAPESILHRLERTSGEEFAEIFDESERAVPEWPRADAARFYGLGAGEAEQAEKPARARALARRSFDLEPTVETGLVLARALRDAALPAEARRVLRHDVFKTGEPWHRKQVMEMLLALDDIDAGLALYATLREEAPHLVADAETARLLAGAGRVAEAREIFAAIHTTPWNAEAVARERFRFEVRHGDAETAVAAYRELVGIDWKADLLLRDRFTLLRAHPASGWTAGDIGRGLLVLVAIGVVAGLPLVVIVPVHYLALLRERRGRRGAEPESPWGLRTVWLIAGLGLLAEFAGFWIWRPDELRAWWSEGHEVLARANVSLMAHQTLIWATLTTGLVVLLARRRGWRSVGSGTWSGPRALAAGLGGMLAIRCALMACATVWPELIFDESAGSASPQTMDLMGELLKAGGPVGLFAVVAVFVPFLEEIAFRSVFLRGFAKYLPFGWANLLQAVLFAALHENVVLFPFFVVFGMACGWLAKKSGGLLPGIVLHIANNALACLAVISQRG